MGGGGVQAPYRSREVRPRGQGALECQPRGARLIVFEVFSGSQTVARAVPEVFRGLVYETITMDSNPGAPPLLQPFLCAWDRFCSIADERFYSALYRLLPHEHIRALQG